MARERTILALDPGSTKIHALVVRIADRAPQVIGAARATAAGIHKGVVVDLGAAAASIAEAARAACRVAGARCERAWVAASGEHIRGAVATTEVEVAAGAVRPCDVDACLREAAAGAAVAPGCEVLHMLPGAFALDDGNRVASPLGMAARRLRVEAFVVTASAGALDNLERAVESAGLTLEQEVLSGLAAAWVATAPQEREAGVLVVDIGGGVTDFIVFRRGVVAQVGCLGIAGGHVTRDIALGMRVTMDEAERLKREEAGALAQLVPASELRLSSGERAERWFLAEIVEARMREILELVGREVERARLKPTLAVLTGGEAGLAGAAQLAEAVLGCPSRLGMGGGLQAVGAARGPEWAVALGIAQYAAQQERPAAPVTTPLGRALRWVRESFR